MFQLILINTHLEIIHLISFLFCDTSILRFSRNREFYIYEYDY